MSIIRSYVRNMFPNIIENIAFPHSYEKYGLPKSIIYVLEKQIVQSHTYQRLNDGLSSGIP